MKNRYLYILLAAAFAGLTSCSSENGSTLAEEELESECSYLSFSPSIDIAGSSSSAKQTRMSDALDDGYTYFDTGVYNFGICVMKNNCDNNAVNEANSYVPWLDGETGTEALWRNSGFQSYFNINAQYTKKTANASDENSELNWYLRAANGKDLYLSRDKAAVAIRRKESSLPKIYAYYPWQDKETVQTVPITEFNAIDYLYATPYQITTDDHVDNDNNREYYRAKLRFNHVTAKIIFDVKNLNKTEVDTVYRAKLSGQQISSSGYYDITNGDYYPSGVRDSIYSTNEAPVVIPAQQTVTDAFTFYIAPTADLSATEYEGSGIFDVRFDIWSMKENTTSAVMPKIHYEKGKVYRITVYISSNRVQFGEPQIEDWIPVTVEDDIIL